VGEVVAVGRGGSRPEEVVGVAEADDGHGAAEAGVARGVGQRRVGGAAYDLAGVGADAEVLAVVAGDADDIGHGVHVEAEGAAGQGDGEGRAEGRGGGGGRVEGVEVAAGGAAEGEELAGGGAEVDGLQGLAAGQAGDGRGCGEGGRVVRVEGEQAVGGGKGEDPARKVAIFQRFDAEALSFGGSSHS